MSTIMNTNSSNKSHLVLRIPKATVELIDTVARASNLTRSAWIRRSLQRSLAYALDCELPVLQQADVQAALNPNGEVR